jgi:hypothetical protein
VLLIGNKTPTGGDMYDKEYVAPSFNLIVGNLDDTINRTAIDQRDKTVQNFTRYDVRGVTLLKGATRHALEKSGDDWILAAP